MEVKNLDKPDEHREFPHGHTEVLSLPGLTFAVATFEPGWQWSKDVAQIAGTKSCLVHHNGFVMSGRARVRMDDDGSEHDIGPGDVVVIPPGHDAWVVGDEPLVLYGFTGTAALYGEAKAGKKQPRRGLRRK
jgi:mannose-6-phosphate isomerase-like protein (cupin superfamily)